MAKEIVQITEASGWDAVVVDMDSDDPERPHLHRLPVAVWGIIRETNDPSYHNIQGFVAHDSQGLVSLEGYSGFMGYMRSEDIFIPEDIKFEAKRYLDYKINVGV